MKNLLLLEEDLEGRETLSRILKKRGFSVVQAEDAGAALRRLDSDSPIDVVLVGASDRDRTEFLSDLRENRPRLPVIFLTDHCGPESRLRGLVYGAFTVSRSHNFYINMRPVGLNELERLIRIVLNKHHSVHWTVPVAA